MCFHSVTVADRVLQETLRGVLDNKSLMGYFAGDQKNVDASKQKLVLIMDEVDGMSAGDRGGVGQLAAVCKKTQVRHYSISCSFIRCGISS